MHTFLLGAVEDYFVHKTPGASFLRDVLASARFFGAILAHFMKQNFKYCAEMEPKATKISTFNNLPFAVGWHRYVRDFVSLFVDRVAGPIPWRLVWLWEAPWWAWYPHPVQHTGLSHCQRTSILQIGWLWTNAAICFVYHTMVLHLLFPKHFNPNLTSRHSVARCQSFSW